MGKLLALLVAGVLGGCHVAPGQGTEHLAVGWRPVGAWAGEGNRQTDSFRIDSTQWRIKWRVNSQPDEVEGEFHVHVFSAVSGRLLGTPIDFEGEGRGVAYVNEDPRIFHLVIDAAAESWSLTVEERVTGTPFQ